MRNMVRSHCFSAEFICYAEADSTHCPPEWITIWTKLWKYLQNIFQRVNNNKFWRNGQDQQFVAINLAEASHRHSTCEVLDTICKRPSSCEGNFHGEGCVSWFHSRTLCLHTANNASWLIASPVSSWLLNSVWYEADQTAGIFSPIQGLHQHPSFAVGLYWSVVKPPCSRSLPIKSPQKQACTAKTVFVIMHLQHPETPWFGLFQIALQIIIQFTSYCSDLPILRELSIWYLHLTQPSNLCICIISPHTCHETGHRGTTHELAHELVFNEILCNISPVPISHNSPKVDDPSTNVHTRL